MDTKIATPIYDQTIADARGEGHDIEAIMKRKIPTPPQIDVESRWQIIERRYAKEQQNAESSTSTVKRPVPRKRS